MAKRGATVTFNDLGLRSLSTRIKQLNALSLSVGIQGKRGAIPVNIDANGGTTFNLATLALVQEFGTDRAGRGNSVTIPARSFLRGAMFQYKSQIEAVISETLTKYLASKSMLPTKALGIIGKFVAGRVKARIDTPGLWAKPNAPSTIKAKGFNRPLHGNTFGAEKLSRNISWAVRAGAGGPIILEGLAR